MTKSDDNNAMECRVGLAVAASVEPMPVGLAGGSRDGIELEPDPPAETVVRRIFDMALGEMSTLDIAKSLNSDGLCGPNGKPWRKTTIHKVLGNEAYTGTLVWGVGSKDAAAPVRVEGAFEAIVSQRDFRQVAKLLRSRAPRRVHPRRSGSRYLLSGVAKCARCGKALTASEAKSGRYTYYVCHSLLKHGRGACETPRLRSRGFEERIVDRVVQDMLTESNIRDLEKLLDDAIDEAFRGLHHRLETKRQETADVDRRLERTWSLVETGGLEVSDAESRIREHIERRKRLERAAEDARAKLVEGLAKVDKVEMMRNFTKDMVGFIMRREPSEARAFLNCFVKEVSVRRGEATIRYAIPTPGDSRMGSVDSAEAALGG